jgi:hypothetical protein
MLVLFDNGTPRTLAKYLIENHTVTEARSRGWDQLNNGDLLREAETSGFDVLITTDKNLAYQQNLSDRRISVVVLGKGRWKLIEPHAQKIASAVRKAKPGDFIEIEISDN